jgi:hypothetical protein
MAFVFRKSEKLTTALYMVTDILTEREPMKWKMRETAVDLLSGVTVSMSTQGGEKLAALSDVLKKLDRMISFLEIAEASSVLSKMNAGVLRKEYVVLKTSIEYEWGKIFDSADSLLDANFFHIPEERLIELKGLDQRVRPKEEETRREIAPRPVRREEETREMPVAVQPVREARPAPAEPVRHEPIRIHPERMHGTLAPRETYTAPASDLLPAKSDESRSKNDRRTIILALIKQKPALGVKDFVKSIPGVSEKTIQRELLAMVSEGVLVKRGERRWSTYSLPSQM